MTDDPKHDLENALVDIRGVAEVLMAIGNTGNQAEVCNYPGGVLMEHRDRALDAWARWAAEDDLQPSCTVVLLVPSTEGEAS